MMRKTIKFLYWLTMTGLFLILFFRQKEIDQLNYIRVEN